MIRNLHYTLICLQKAGGIVIPKRKVTLRHRPRAVGWARVRVLVLV